MNVTFISFGEHIASSRLRAIIPQQELAKLGVHPGRDIAVYGKHIVPIEALKWAKKRVFDVCDDHFGTRFDDYYREHIAAADLVTCNSETMAAIIQRETGCEAVVIPDPYESEEKPAAVGKDILWFGHQSNLVDVEPYMDLAPRILTGDYWSRERQLQALHDCAVVIIPTGKSMAKSANRLIESVRNGRFVIAGYLPAHEEFKKWMWVGDIRDGVEWFKAYPKRATDNITECQRYIRDKYSPEAIGRRWLNALEQL